ncbi:MAG: hypothetical protein ABL926_09745 [Novosphingobium sp.]|uniref:hypothetical protein n=1 Tax=Novosphingobium sp. TaxID=1874826 RepID=UPI0032B838C4
MIFLKDRFVFSLIVALNLSACGRDPILNSCPPGIGISNEKYIVEYKSKDKNQSLVLMPYNKQENQIDLVKIYKDRAGDSTQQIINDFKNNGDVTGYAVKSRIQNRTNYIDGGLSYNNNLLIQKPWSYSDDAHKYICKSSAVIKTGTGAGHAFDVKCESESGIKSEYVLSDRIGILSFVDKDLGVVTLVGKCGIFAGASKRN